MGAHVFTTGLARLEVPEQVVFACNHGSELLYAKALTEPSSVPSWCRLIEKRCIGGVSNPSGEGDGVEFGEVHRYVSTTIFARNA
ncbi:hypothetical protein [Mesorhizobium sp. 1M-11]|uniref:hypothetical protein n=1 Tax=Mesorhizobium sp. 1M-11 TaxID=1529006 RepID=UPI0006C7687A|nr:hypothetical protein [Mesorhizobium sp. 1M-11]